MSIKLPGFVYSALLVALVAFLQAVATGLDSLQDWWVPAAALLVAAALKAVEAYQANLQNDAPADIRGRNIQPRRGFWNRFMLC